MGTLVVCAGGMRLWDVPRVLFPEVPVSTSAEFLYVLAFFMRVAALMLPFDLVGGILIPAALESRSPNPRVWLRRWLRSVSIQSLFFFSHVFHLLANRPRHWCTVAGGPLARAVHCNVGKPGLWAMMPVD